MDEAELLELLRTRLSLDVITTSNYTGGMDSGPMYTDCHTLRLMLDDEVINEVSI